MSEPDEARDIRIGCAAVHHPIEDTPGELSQRTRGRDLTRDLIELPGLDREVRRIHRITERTARLPPGGATRLAAVPGSGDGVTLRSASIGAYREASSWMAFAARGFTP